MATVVYQDVPNSPQRVALVQGGDADVAQYLRPRELQQLESVEGVRVDSVQGTQQTWIELNAKIEPFDDVRVRQAMNYAFPFQEVLDTVYLGYGRPLGTGIPTIYPFATEEYFPYTTDLDKAQALLEEAGAAGLSTTLSYNAGVPEQEEISTLYQTTLREIGVNIELNKLPAGTFYDFVSKRSEPMIYYTDAPWNPDPGICELPLLPQGLVHQLLQLRERGGFEPHHRRSRDPRPGAARADVQGGPGDLRQRGAVGFRRPSRPGPRRAGQYLGLGLLHVEQRPLPGLHEDLGGLAWSSREGTR